MTIHDRTADMQAPLTPYSDDEGSFFKVYLADTGIMFQKFGIDASLVLDNARRDELSADFRGALAENYVMQALRSNEVRSFYWMPEGSGMRGEVEFLLQTKSAEVVPVEVKSGRNVSAKSLRMSAGRSPYAIRLSEKEFGKTVDDEGRELRSVPLYAAFCIE